MGTFARAATFISFAVMPFASQAQADSFSIYFPSGIAIPDAAQTAYLDSLLYVGKIPGTGTIAITGYGDEPGGDALNKTIAEKRAASVKAYLLSTGFDANRIVKCFGAGNLVRSGTDEHQRRADIVCMRSEPPPLQIGPPPKTSSRIDSVAAARVDSVAAAKKRKQSLKDLGRMKEDELLVIENLLFKVSTPEIVRESLPVLDELVDVLKVYPQLKIRIEGHICCGTNSKDSDKLKLGYHLSLDRARAVKVYLEEHQIAENRLSAAGFGFSRPKVYPEVTQEDMRLNRRVEIRVISN